MLYPWDWLYIIAATFSGVLSEADVKMFYTFVRCYAPLGQPYHELIDYSEVHSHDLDQQVLQAASENEFRKRESRDERAKTAFVSQSQLIIAMIESYYQTNTHLRRIAQIFPDRQQAMDWLLADR